MKKTLLQWTRLTVGQFYLVDKYSLDRTDCRVKQLVKTERAFKRAYGVDVKVAYVDDADKVLIAKQKTKGYHSTIKNQIVVFLTDDIERNRETLLHELVHAYQYQYMTNKFTASRKQLADEEVTYKNAWHERHARRCAKLLMQGDFTIALNKTAAYKAV